MTEIKSGAILNYLSLFLRLGIGFFLGPFILYHLGRSEYGVYAIAGSIVGWLAMSDLGLTTSTTKFLSEYQAKGDRDGEAHYLGNVAAIFSIMGLVVLVLGLCIFPFLDRIFPKFTEDEMGIYRILYLLTLFNTAFLFPSRSLCGIASSRQKFKVPGIVMLLNTSLTFIGTVVILSLGYKSIVLMSFTVAFGVFGLAWNVYYCFGILKARMTWNGWDLPLCKTVLSFSFWIFLDNIITMMNWGCGNMIIGMTCGASEIAVYSYGLALMQHYNNYAGCITSLFLPKIVRQVCTGASNEELTQAFINNGRMQFCILMLPLFALIFLGPTFYNLWLGHTLKDDVYTTWIISLILVGTFTIPAIQNLGWIILQAKNAIRLRVKVMIFVALVNLILGFALSLQYGVIGLAIGTALSVIMGQGFFMNWLYAKHIGLNVKSFVLNVTKGSLLPIVLYMLAGLPIACFLHLYPTWINFIAMGLLYTFIYTTITYKLYMNDRERSLCPPWIQKCLGFSQS